MHADWLHLLTPAAFLTLWWLGTRYPARQYAQPARPSAKAGAVATFAGVGMAVPLLIPAEWLASRAWLDGQRWGVAGGALIGWLAWTCLQYWFHRACHRLPGLWRLHRLHHSARWMDVFVGTWFHPLEMALVIVLNHAVTLLLLGLSPVAAAIVSQAGVLSLLLIHSNVRTPGWIGCLVYRPEAHLLHHQRGIHHGNFCDFPVWDLVFGTYRKPSGVYAGPLGFEAPLSASDLLLGRRINHE